MNDENNDVIKSIDGVLYYKYDYTDFLYQKLEDFKSRFDKANDYIENELFKGKADLEWSRKNGGTISGSDLPTYCILDLYDILKGDNNE